MTVVCPKCQYQRRPVESAPEWQCPNCGVAYVKVAGDLQSPSGGKTLYEPEPTKEESRSGIFLATIGLILICAMGLSFALKRLRDPYQTSIPDPLNGIASIQAKLDRLPKRDRELVIEYINRRDGHKPQDELDFPDVELTHEQRDFKARTFAEAISFEREERESFHAAKRDMASHAAAAWAKEDATYAPLRHELELTLTKLDIEQLPERRQRVTIVREGIEYDSRGAKQPLPALSAYLVLTFNLQNTSTKIIDGVRGYALLYRGRRRPMSFTAAECEIALNDMRMDPGTVREVRCAAARASESVLPMPPDAFELVWKPQEIKHDDGDTLTVNGGQKPH